MELGEAVGTSTRAPERGEGAVAGDVVNTASWLQGAGAVGGAPAGPGTHAVTRRVFDDEAQARAGAEGQGEPVAVSRFPGCPGTEPPLLLATPTAGR